MKENSYDRIEFYKKFKSSIGFSFSTSARLQGILLYVMSYLYNSAFIPRRNFR